MRMGGYVTMMAAAESFSENVVILVGSCSNAFVKRFMQSSLELTACER